MQHRTAHTIRIQQTERLHTHHTRSVWRLNWPALCDWHVRKERLELTNHDHAFNKFIYIMCPTPSTGRLFVHSMYCFRESVSLSALTALIDAFMAAATQRIRHRTRFLHTHSPEPYFLYVCAYLSAVCLCCFPVPSLVCFPSGAQSRVTWYSTQWTVDSQWNSIDRPSEARRDTFDRYNTHLLISRRRRV